MIDRSPNQRFDPDIQKAFEFSPGGLLVVDGDGRILAANRGAGRIFGYTPEEIHGKPIGKLIPAGDWSKEAGPARDCSERLKTLARLGGLYGRSKDLVEFPIEIDVSAVEAEGEARVVIAVAEPRTSKRAQQLFRAAIESAPSGMVIVDGSGEIVLINREIERLFGYRREELLGKSVEMLVPERFRARHPQYRADYSQSPSTRLMGGGRDLFGRRKDGSEVPVEIGLNPIQTDQGLFVLGVIVDISERKKAEEALRRSADELKRSNSELEQFAYIASHDLQEPLRMVTGFLQLLQQRSAGHLDQKQQEYIDYAVDGATRMSRLINDLLEYSRVQRKKRAVEQTDLNRTLESALFNLQKSIEDSYAVICRGDSLPVIKGDPTQLTQVFQNLIGNAVKFRREGVRPEISVNCRRDGKEWVLSVHDNGIGIDPEQAERVFMIFQRLHSRKEYPGTGIGLAICKKIIEQHGGRIWVDSKPQEGSTFSFTLPAA